MPNSKLSPGLSGRPGGQRDISERLCRGNGAGAAKTIYNNIV